jgi:hypothetical protein
LKNAGVGRRFAPPCVFEAAQQANAPQQQLKEFCLGVLGDLTVDELSGDMVAES